MFHNRIVWSYEPEAILVPSGEIATEVTPSSCPSSGLPIIALVFESHILTVRSIDPDAINVPSGGTATEITHSR